MLQYEDEVNFHIKGKKIAHSVMRSAVDGRLFLGCKDDSNDHIFGILELNGDKLCEEEYGYTLGSGGWPWSKPHDYEGLTRAVRRVYKEAGETYEDDIKTSRFSLIDFD